MSCCGSSGNAFVQTRFLGASVVRFSANADWGGNGGGLQVELVEDLCNGDAFNPTNIGSPVYFSIGGFSYGGILQNWKQSDSATGEKTYLVNVSSPRLIVEGAQVILNSYNGSSMATPNLLNVYGWLEAVYGAACTEPAVPDLDYTPASGYGGAQNNEVGIPWYLIRLSLSSMLGGGVTQYGGRLLFNGRIYYVDLSDLPVLNGNIRLGGESICLEDLIAQVCNLGGCDYFYELLYSGGVNVIKVRVSSGAWQAYDKSAEDVDQAYGSNIENRLALGAISGAIGAADCTMSYGRGLELRHEVTNSFITGEFRQDLWQVPYSGTGNGQDTIWPYWGKNLDTSVVIGTGYSDGTFPSAINKTDHGHYFTVNVAHLNLGITTWTVSMIELQAAAVGRGEWEAWLWEREPAKLALLYGVAETNIKGMNWLQPGIGGANGGMKSLDTQNWLKTSLVDLGAQGEESEHRYMALGRLYEFIRSYAQNFFGRKFLVKLPFLTRRYNPDTPWEPEANWNVADSAWTEYPVLGLAQQNWALEQFRQDDGKIRCMLRFQSATPVDVSGLSKSDYIAITPYDVYVAGTATEIVWVSPTDARAVVEIGSPVYALNPYDLWPEWLLTFGLLWSEHEGDKDEYLRLVNQVGQDKLIMGLEQLPLLPVGAAVPLQSRRLVYGPWFSNSEGSFLGDDKGKTAYQRESGFAPWNFGSTTLMNQVARSTATTMLGDKYVVEMGDIQFPGAPVGTLGQLIMTGGPAVSSVDVQVDRGEGVVSTTYRMKTYTPDWGSLSRKRLEQIRHSLSVGLRANRIFRQKVLEYNRNFLDIELSHQVLSWQVASRFSGKSSVDLFAAQAYEDPTDSTCGRTSVVSSDGRKMMMAAGSENDAEWRRRAIMENAGLFRPFSTLGFSSAAASDDAPFMPHWRDESNTSKYVNEDTGSSTVGDYKFPRSGLVKDWDTDFYSHEQLPPVIGESHLPINIATLSPFLSSGQSTHGGTTLGTSSGHDIEYIARDGVYPTSLCVRGPSDNYSSTHWYRAIALRGPLVLAGWGYDIDNKPVPNKSATYPANPELAFEDNWLRKPQDWMCGPVDLRWDYKRHVWTAPSPMKIVRVELTEDLASGSSALGILYGDQVQYDSDGVEITAEQGEDGEKYGYPVVVHNGSDGKYYSGNKVTCHYDTTYDRCEIAFSSNSWPTMICGYATTAFSTTDTTFKIDDVQVMQPLDGLDVSYILDESDEVTIWNGGFNLRGDDNEYCVAVWNKEENRWDLLGNDSGLTIRCDTEGGINIENATVLEFNCNHFTLTEVDDSNGVAVDLFAGQSDALIVHNGTKWLKLAPPSSDSVLVYDSSQAAGSRVRWVTIEEFECPEEA